MLQREEEEEEEEEDGLWKNNLEEDDLREDSLGEDDLNGGLEEREEGPEGEPEDGLVQECLPQAKSPWLQREFEKRETSFLLSHRYIR